MPLANSFAIITVALTLAVQATSQDKTEEKPAEKVKIPRTLTSARLEKILAEMKIKYEKTSKKTVDSYDFERNKLKVRLNNYQGHDLWLDVQFSEKMSLDLVNQWNVRAKFSRAVLLKGDGKQSTSLESQIDCEGGITDGMVRQFILRFDTELKGFLDFITK